VTGARFGVSDALAIVGACCLTVGVGLWSVPAGLVTAGLLLVVASAVLMRTEGS